MSRTRRYLQGVSFGYAQQGLALLVGLWLTPFLLRHLGEAQFGQWSVLAQLLGMLPLVDFGIIPQVQRDVGGLRGVHGSEGAAEPVARLVHQVAAMLLAWCAMLLPTLVAVWLLFPVDWHDLRWPVTVAACGYLLFLPTQAHHAALTGMQDFRFLGIIGVVGWLLRFAVVVVCVLAEAGLLALALGWLATELTNSLTAVLRLRHLNPSVGRGLRLRFDWAQTKTLLRSGSWISINRFSGVMIRGVDLLIIERVLGPEAVVPYVCTAKLPQIFKAQPAMLLSAALPGISEVRASSESGRLRSVTSALAMATLLFSGLFAVTTLAVNDDFVAVWVGADRYGGIGLTALVVANMALRHWAHTLNLTLFALQRERFNAILNLLEGLLSLGLGVQLAASLGTEGVAIGAVVAVCAVGIPARLAVVGQGLAEPVLRFAAPQVLLVFWLAAFGAIAAWSSRLTDLTSWPSLIVASSLCGACYVAWCAPVALRPPLKEYIAPRLRALRRTLLP